MIDPDVLHAFIEEHGLSFKSNTASYIFDCPRCGKRDKLYIRQRDGRFTCWFCREISGFHGAAEFALAELASLPLAVVKKALYGADADLLAPSALDLTAFSEDFGPPIDDVQPVRWPLSYLPIDHQLSAKGVEYLIGRGISLEVAKEYGLHYSPDERRIAFPVTMAGQLVGWQARLVVPHRIWSETAKRWRELPKVLSSRGIPRDQTVMFEDRIKEHVVLCEGPIDALKAHLCGGNVATMGKAVSRGQIQLFRRRGVKRIYLALDPDAAQETGRLVEEFTDLECYLMAPPPPYKDIGEMPMDEVLALFQGAKRVTAGRLFVCFGRR